ncbi:EamA/RhaT family transporter, partial [Mesorhizobium sp. M7D.F.Ca.US.004.01.2.1]
MTAGPGSSTAAASDRAGGHNTLTGITLKIISVAVFVGMQTCIKAAGTVPAGEIVFFRSFFAIFPIIAFLAFKGKLGTAFTTKR